MVFMGVGFAWWYRFGDVKWRFGGAGWFGRTRWFTG